MDLLKSAKDTWNNHYSKTILEYPDEEVVRFLNRYKNRKGTGKLIDLGCGTGRHTVAALKLGYEVTAIDYVKHCLEVTESRVESMGKQAKYIQNDDIDIPLETGSTDVVIAWGSIFYNKRNRIIEFLKEVRRVLKEDGEIFCDFRTQNDDLYCNVEKYGEFIDDNTILLKENVGMAGSHLYFTTLDDLREIVKEAGFEIFNIEKFEFTERNMTKLNSWYHVVLKK